MAVAFRSASSGTTLGTALPTGNAQDDVLFAQVYTEGVEPFTPTAATGWNLIDLYTTDPVTGDVSSTAWYWIARGGSAPATNWSCPGTTWSEAAYVCYSGADTTSPIDVYAKNQDTGAGTTTVNWATITTLIANDMIVGIAAVSHFASSTSANWVNERVDAGAASAAHFFDDGIKVVAGSVAAKTETAGIGWSTIMLGLKPATAGGVSAAPVSTLPPPLLIPTVAPLRFPGPTAGPDPPALTADPQDASTIIVVAPPALLLPAGIPLRFPGPGVDAASQVVSVSDTDTGTGSEGVPNIAFTATGDTGAGTEGTPGIAFTVPGDTGAGSEGTPGIGQSASETGTGTETATLTVTMTVTETGTGTGGTPDIAFSAPETGAGADAVSASSRASSASETATGTDLVTDRAFVMSDTGGGADTGGVVTSGGGGINIAGAETGKGTDKGTVQKGDRFTWLKARYSGLPSDL